MVFLVSEKLMARNLTAAQVLKAINQLRDDVAMQGLRKKIQRRHDQHEGVDDPILPDHMTRTGVAYLNSLRPAHLMQTLASFMASYPTTTTIYPENKTQDAHKADEAEKRLALLRADLFPEKIRAEMRWHQGISGPGVYKLNCHDPGHKPQWSVEVCDILSVYYPNPRTAPESPRRVGREYTMLASEIIDKYGQNRSKQPNDNDGKTRLTNNAGDWSFTPISRAVAVSDVGGTDAEPQASSDDDFTPYIVTEYDDGECTYVIVKNKRSDITSNLASGTKVWQYKNLIKGTHYVVVPGYMSGASSPEGRVLPYLNGVQNVISQIDFTRACRATRFTAQRFQVMVERDPELMKAAQSLGWVQQVEAQGAQFERDVMYFDGRPYAFSLPPDEDMKAIEESLEREYQEMASSELNVTTAEVVTQGTARGQQLAVGQREKQKTLMLSYEDEAEKLILKKVIETILNPDGYTPEDTEGWGYFAIADAAYSKGAVTAGERLYFSKETFDFPFEVSITTASKTDEQKQIAFDGVVRAIEVGLGFTDEALEAKGIQNIPEWLRLKAIDDAYKAISAAMGPNYVLTTFQQRLALRKGILIQLAGSPFDAGAGFGTSPAGGQPNAFPAPNTEGVSGGSGPATTNGAAAAI